MKDETKKDVQTTFRHEFAPGIGYEGTISSDSTPSWWDNLRKQSVHREKVQISVYDFEKETLLGTFETKWVNNSRFARIQMAHALRRQELQAWELCKEHAGKDIPFSSAVEDGLISGT